MSAMVPDRQPAPVEVQLDLPTTAIAPPGDPWPVTGIYGKTITISAAGVWAGNIDVLGSPDGSYYSVLGTVTPGSPTLLIEESLSFISLDAVSDVTGAPVAWLTGLSYWGEV